MIGHPIHILEVTESLKHGNSSYPAMLQEKLTAGHEGNEEELEEEQVEEAPRRSHLFCFVLRYVSWNLCVVFAMDVDDVYQKSRGQSFWNFENLQRLRWGV